MQGESIPFWFPMKPAIRTRIDLQLYKDIENDSNWQATPKIDGNRCWIKYYSKDRIEFWSRFGNLIYEKNPEFLQHLRDELAQMGIPDMTMIDSELHHPCIRGFLQNIGKSWIEKNGLHSLMVFDIVLIGGEYITALALKKRWKELSTLKIKGQFVEQAKQTFTGKQKMYDKCMQLPNGEGLCLKHIDSTYVLGEGSTVYSDMWVKVKKGGC